MHKETSLLLPHILHFLLVKRYVFYSLKIFNSFPQVTYIISHPYSSPSDVELI